MTCPGVGRPPEMLCRPQAARPRGLCAVCWREYSLTAEGVMRHHQGLPKRPDGGCPYRCPDDCDFNCYIPKGAS